MNMSAGVIPVDIESIRFIDPKKIKTRVESSSSSEDDKDDWYSSQRLSRRAKPPSDSDDGDSDALYS